MVVAFTDTSQARYDLAKIGLSAPKKWMNDLESLDDGCTMDKDVYKTVEALKKKFGHKVILPLMTDLHENFLLIATSRDYSETGAVLYIRNRPYNFVGVITKPQGLVNVVRGLTEHGSSALDFDEIEFEGGL